MQLKCHCDFCGLSFHNSNLIHVEGYVENLKISNSSVRCPRCGRRARVLDGTYSFVGNSVKTFRDANYQQLQQLKEVAQAAAAGVINAQEAKAKSDDIVKGSGNLAEFAVRWQLLPLFLGALTLYINWVMLQSSNRPSPEVMAAFDKIDAHIEQLYQEEIISRSTIPGFQTYSARRLPPTHTLLPSKTPSGLNRAQRRREAALARKPPT